MPATGLSFRLLATTDDARWAATVMSGTDPWRTLGRDHAQCLATVQAPDREVHLAIGADGQRLGVAILALRGPFSGYLQSIAVAPEARDAGVGSALLDHIEARIFSEMPNVFLCVSSFNTNARRLYERRGYTLIGTITDYLVAGHDEHLFRKTRGPRDGYRPANG